MFLGVICSEQFHSTLSVPVVCLCTATHTLTSYGGLCSFQYHLHMSHVQGRPSLLGLGRAGGKLTGIRALGGVAGRQDYEPCTRVLDIGQFHFPHLFC